MRDDRLIDRNGHRAISSNLAFPSVIVPVLDKHTYLRRSIDSILTALSILPRSELIIVDNGSIDGSYEILKTYYTQAATVIQLLDVYVGAVRNGGARRATGQYLCFIDADCVVRPYYFQRLLEVFEDPAICATGCRVGLPPNPHWIERTWHEIHQRPTDGDRAYINSGNFAVRRQAFEAVGGFDETLQTGEDAEICMRLRQRGCRIYETRAMEVAHLDNPKTIAGFFKKEVWHGLGTFGTAQGLLLDKPTVVTLGQAGALAVAALILALWPWSGWVNLTCGATAILLPSAVTLGFRIAQGGRTRRLDLAMLLYLLYFIARGVAICRVLRRDLGRLLARNPLRRGSS